jgi:DNA-binding SARP family transcriptional activator
MGQLRLVDEAGTHSLSARKIEILLTALLIRADQVVSVDSLMKEVWGEILPRRATAGVHVYVSQIRKFLHRPGRGECPVQTRPPGYVLRLGDDELDVHEFDMLMTHGRDAARQGRHERAAAVLEKALALWNGPAMDDVHTGPILSGYQTWLNESRLECLEMLMESRLRQGQHRQLVSTLYLLTTEHPLREAFHHQLMLALYRCGRRADALRAYQAVRGLLDEELGLEPCRALRELHQSILTSDDRLELRVAV